MVTFMVWEASNEFFKYIDILRYQRGMSQEDICFDITDVRQYRKYLKGEVRAPLSVIIPLCNRLELRFENIFYEFSKRFFIESQDVTTLLNKVINYDFDNSYRLLRTIKKESILQKENVLIYDTACLLLEFYDKKTRETDFVKRLRELICYPEILKKDVLSLGEAYAMGILLNYVNGNDTKTILSKIESMYANPTIINYGDNIRVLSLLLFRLVKHHAKNCGYDDVRRLCNIAIESSHKNNTIYLLEYFYYSLAFCENEVGSTAKRDEYVFKCYAVLEIDGNEPAKKKFQTLIESDFKTPLYEQITNFINMKLKK